jgi:hypothetical protein
MGETCIRVGELDRNCGLYGVNTVGMGYSNDTLTL